MEYTFTLKYQLSVDDDDQSAIVERLGAEGCDDALIGVGNPGRIALEFIREGNTAEIALFSALSDVNKAIPTAKLIEASPDFVGLTDAADVAGVTRQNMRKLMINHPTKFPIPVHEGSVSIWHLADILDWLKSKGGYTIKQDVIDIAHAAKQINLSKDNHLYKPNCHKFEKIVIDQSAVKKRIEDGQKEADRIISEMEKKGVTVKLFGSIKTGKAFPNSDIDLLVTDCGQMDPEIVLVEIHAMEKEIPLDVMLLQYVPEKNIERVMEDAARAHPSTAFSDATQQLKQPLDQAQISRQAPV